MHELSVAMSLIDVITEEMIRNHAAGALSVTVEIGALSGVVPEALQTAFTIATRGTELADTTLRIDVVKVAVRCNACQAVREAVSQSDIRCAVCGTASTDVVRGRELDVVAMEIDDGTPNPPGPDTHSEG
ncbi:MAG: hydrogenase maturation nickel metallochaperone HypA [Burkholderiales bacterium]|nr:hydrogenase maturation nickel metallochaperone HypA [Phycisphaerae bacterium]